jgi:tetratricopeptide (TPR) repeat protein
VVAVTVVVVAAVAISSSAASAAAAAAGGAVTGVENSTGTPTGSSSSTHEGKGYSGPNETPCSESLTSSLQTQVSTFKETIAQEQFAAICESNGISMEENGRIIGSLFAHKAVDSLTNSFAQNPTFANELKDFGFNSQYPTPRWLQTYPDSSKIMPHTSIDLAFSTDYTTSYAGNFGDLNAMSYQVRGDMALSSQCYAQAVQDFGNAISLDPTNPILYLERGIANFELGNYEQSIADYPQFVDKKAEPFSVTDFSLGFAKGVPKGAYESGKGALLFLSDFITHPVQTSRQVVDSISQLATLVRNDEFGIVAEALSPELHQLVTQWDNLPSGTRGELAGYAVGKLGTDLLAPGAVVKIASKSTASAKELIAVCKNLQIAQEALVLETAAGIGVPVKVGEIVEMGKRTVNLGEELGFTAQEMGQLQKAGKLESAVSSACEYLSPEWKKSFELFDKAQKFLKPYKGFMPEPQARELIHQTGIKTFPRPSGIPENYRVKLSDNGAGMKYVHPTDEGTYTRST